MLFSFKLISGEIVQHQVKTDVVTIGRSKSCTIVAPYDGISRNHCQVNFENGEIFVTDLGSTNGVFIDGTKVEPNVKIPYQTFLTFSIGSIQSITIEFDDKTSVKDQAPLIQFKPGGPSQDHSNRNNDHTSTQAYTSEIQKTQKEIVLKLKTPPAKESISSQKTQKDPQKKKTQEKKSLAKPLIIVLALAAVFWFLTQEENSDQPVETEPTESSKSSEKNYEQF